MHEDTGELSSTLLEIRPLLPSIQPTSRQTCSMLTRGKCLNPMIAEVFVQFADGQVIAWKVCWDWLAGQSRLDGKVAVHLRELGFQEPSADPPPPR